MPRWTSRVTDRLQQAAADRQAMLERTRVNEPPPARHSWYDPIAYYQTNYQAYSTASVSQTAWPTTVDWFSNSTAIDSTAWYTTAGTTNDIRMVYDWQQYTPAYTTPAYAPMQVWTGQSWEPAAVLTLEEADRRLAATREAQFKTAIRRKKAIKKGRKLLMTVLTDEQQREYAKTRSFTVNGQNGRRFKLRKSGTTHELDENGVALYSHCIHLPYSYIDEDTLVAVKLLLETDVQSFLKIANTTKLNRSMPAQQGALVLAEGFEHMRIAADGAREAARTLGQALESHDEMAIAA